MSIPAQLPEHIKKRLNSETHCKAREQCRKNLADRKALENAGSR
jgi:hypothetical protein